MNKGVRNYMVNVAIRTSKKDECLKFPFNPEFKTNFSYAVHLSNSVSSVRINGRFSNFSLRHNEGESRLFGTTK